MPASADDPGIVDLGSDSDGGDSPAAAQRSSDDEEELDLVVELNVLQTAGSFAHDSEIEEDYDPGIVVNGVGPISLPLTERSAQSIIEVSHQAPFGKGDETVVDTSVRKTWELNCDQFSVQSPQWKELIDKILAKVVKELGMEIEPSCIDAQLYKMLLYGEGAMFKPHKDSEKVPGMFGTLVICLKSEHRGGVVRLSHAGQEKVFRSEDGDNPWACWYSDVTHEVTEVTSGYRWVLTYNLVRTGDSPHQSASMLRENYRYVRNGLKQWGRKTIIVLDHKHTEANLKFEKLRGNDLAKARILKEACAQTGFSIFLANLERYHYGGCDEDGCESEDDYYSSRRNRKRYRTKRTANGCHPIIDPIADELKLKSVLDANNSQVGENVDVETDDFYRGDPFYGRDPDEEDYSGFTGNEGCSATHWYRDTVLVVVPRDQVVDFVMAPFLREKAPHRYSLNKSSFTFHEVFVLFVDEVLLDEKSERARQDLAEVCRVVLSHAEVIDNKVKGSSLRFWKEVFNSAILLQDRDLFETAIKRVGDKLRSEMFEDFAKDIKAQGLETLRESLEKAIVLKLRRLHEQYRAIENLGQAAKRLHPSGPEAKQWEAWEISMVGKALTGASANTAADADAIIRLLGRPEMFGVYMAQIEQAAKEAIGCVPFGAQLLGQLFQIHGVHPSREGASAKALIRRLAEPFVENFSLQPVEYDEPPRKLPRHGSYGPLVAVARPPKQPMDAQCLYALSVAIEGLKGDALTARFIEKAKKEVWLIHPLHYLPMLLPGLRKLAVTLKVASWPHRELFQSFFKTSIRACQRRYVGIVGHSPSWARPRLPCNERYPIPGSKCKCGQLNDFLANPDKQVAHFPGLISGERGHFHDMAGLAGCTHETDRRTDTLVVTKREAVQDRGMGSWEDRFQKTEKQLKELLEYTGAEALLGSDWEQYTEATMLEYLLRPPEDVRKPDYPVTITCQSMRSQPLNIGGTRMEGPGPVPTGKKRKAKEVIDLTGED